MLSVLLLAVATAGCGDNLAPALAALQQNDPQKAKSILAPLASECAKSSSYFELLGAASGMSGDAVGAENAFKTAVSIDPNSSRIQAELGAAYLRNKKPKLAAEALAHAVALDPSNQDATKYLLGSYVELKDWTAAAAVFKQIGADKQPGVLRDPLLVLWFAQTLLQTNRAASIDQLLSPDQPVMTPPLLFSLGRMFAEQRLYPLAVKYLQAIPPDKADDAVHFNLGLAYSHLRNFDEARKSYFEAIDQRPDHTNAYFRVGLDFASEGNVRKSIPWLLRAHALDPAQPDIAYALIEQLLHLEYVDTAATVLSDAAHDKPPHPLLLVAQGDLQQSKGDLSGAIDTYKKVLLQQPGMVPALVALGRAYLKQSNDREARVALEAALQKDPNDPPANAELGLLEARQENWNSALTHLRKSWAADTSNTQVALALARSYMRLNRADEALLVLAPLRPSLQDSAAYHLQLAQLYTQLKRPADAKTEQEALAVLQAQSQSSLRFDAPKTYVY